MKSVVNEPQVAYKTAGWRAKSKEISFDNLICGIDDDIIMIFPPGIFTSMIISKKPKRKLSELRGKTTKQSKREIDDQISKLREEWDRNI